MPRSFPLSSCLAWPLLAALGGGVACAQDNIVPIEVRQLRSGQFNRVFVEVTVCNAAQQCRTVPDVTVDTGSVGLRLYRKALEGLELDAVTDAQGRPLFNGPRFGIGFLWGSMHWAQVGLGIGAPSESLFRVGARRVSHELDADGQFEVRIGERRLDVLVDSGSNLLMLDLDHLGFARWASAKAFYDVATPTPLTLTVPAGADEVELTRPLYIGRAAALKKACGGGYGVLPMLAIAPQRKDAPNVLGLPFFYGRTVATGLQGSANPYHDALRAGRPLPSFDVEEALSVYSDEVASDGDDGAAGPPPPYGFIVYTD